MQQRGEDIVPLTRELIARGASLNTEALVIASASVTKEELCSKWGFRIGKFSREVATRMDGVAMVNPSAEPDTTPLMWACRVGAMGVFEAILEYLAENLG